MLHQVSPQVILHTSSIFMFLIVLKFAIFLEAFVEDMKFTDKSVQPAILWTN